MELLPLTFPSPTPLFFTHVAVGLNQGAPVNFSSSFTAHSLPATESCQTQCTPEYRSQIGPTHLVLFPHSPLSLEPPAVIFVPNSMCQPQCRSVMSPSCRTPIIGPVILGQRPALPCPRHPIRIWSCILSLHPFQTPDPPHSSQEGFSPFLLIGLPSPGLGPPPSDWMVGSIFLSLRYPHPAPGTTCRKLALKRMVLCIFSQVAWAPNDKRDLREVSLQAAGTLSPRQASSSVASPLRTSVFT
jgi:hypothetical protein